MITQQHGRGMTLFTAASVVVLILWLPVRYSSSGMQEILSLFTLWIGLLYTVMMQSRRVMGNPVTLFPIFQSYMALTGYTMLQEGGFILAAFFGTLVYAMRTGVNLKECAYTALRFTLMVLFSMRITAVIFQGYRNVLLAGIGQTILALVGGVLLSLAFNHLVQLFMESSELDRIKMAFGRFLRAALYPSLFVLFLLPAAIQVGTEETAQWKWTVLMGVAAILVVQTGLTALLDRARYSYSRTRFLENELGKHSEILTNLETPIEALRTLALFWYRAALPLAVRVKWKNVSMIYPPDTELPVTAPLSRRGTGGLLLEVWPSLKTTLDSERLEIFVTQTETVLQNLELRSNLLRRGWKCLEAMVYSLDMSDSKQTGYSKKVASVAINIGRELGIPETDIEDLEMSAMLHLTSSILEKAEEDWQETFSSEPSRIQFQLPPKVVRGIRHITENFDGTGYPDNLNSSRIPLISRIISVASNFVAALSTFSADNALSDLRMRAGSIYDPEIVDVLERLVEQQSTSLLTENEF